MFFSTFLASFDARLMMWLRGTGRFPWSVGKPDVRGLARQGLSGLLQVWLRRLDAGRGLGLTDRFSSHLSRWRFVAEDRFLATTTWRRFDCVIRQGWLRHRRRVLPLLGAAMAESINRCCTQSTRFLAVNEARLAHDLVRACDDRVDVVDVRHMRRIDIANVVVAAAIEGNEHFARGKRKPDDRRRADAQR